MPADPELQVARFAEAIDRDAPPISIDEIIGHGPIAADVDLPTARSPWLLFSVAAGLIAVLVAGLIAVTNHREPSPATVPEPTADASVDSTIAPGAVVELPDWPLSERTTPPRVWTGTELIAWGDGINGRAGDGAALDLANGTWRVIAPAPISERSEPAAAWTGTEMIVWGGRIENRHLYDGAAYNPATDTWRLLSPAPTDFTVADPTVVWTGNEAVVLGASAAAYDPVTDSWRTLANPPEWSPTHTALWTGDSIVVTEPVYGMTRYDMTVDRWSVVDVGSPASMVGVPGSDGRVGTFVRLPSETGAPVQLIDSTGSPIAELPAFPGEPDVFGDDLWAYGLWVGDEAVFEISSSQVWAFSPSMQTWRRLDVGTTFPRLDQQQVVVAGDLLLMWNRPGDVYQGPPRSCCPAPPGKGGAVYRVAPPD